MMGKKLFLVGMRFGKLTVVAEGPLVKAAYTWKCVCDCGVTTTVRGGALKSGNTTSCGCHKRSVLGISTTKHGGANSKVYWVWGSMVQRCTNVKNRDYHLYGGRGIEVCSRWMQFQNFVSDMGYPPPGTSIDRIDNNKAYEPSNCRWATAEEQSHNRRNNRWIEVDGVNLILADWANRIGISPNALLKRLSKVDDEAAAIRLYLGDLVKIEMEG